MKTLSTLQLLFFLPQKSNVFFNLEHKLQFAYVTIFHRLAIGLSWRQSNQYAANPKNLLLTKGRQKIKYWVKADNCDDYTNTLRTFATVSLGSWQRLRQYKLLLIYVVGIVCVLSCVREPCIDLDTLWLWEWNSLLSYNLQVNI